jgi:uncharacterized protein YbaP (TraB family)
MMPFVTVSRHSPSTHGMPLGRRCFLSCVTALVAAVVLLPWCGAGAAGRSFAWKASGKGGTVHLVGSVHLLSKDYYPLNPILESAFDASEVLVEELDLGEVSQPQSQGLILARGVLPAGETLSRVVSPATYARVSQRLEGLGLPIEALSRLKPWALALTLLAVEWQKAGFDANLGLDRHFFDRATSTGKMVQGLETLEFQISRFDGLTNDQQDRMLAETLQELDTQKSSVVQLADAWRSGDVAAVERVVLKDVQQDKQMYERLIVDRNREWLPHIDALFTRRGAAFVVVGAAHLVGPDGLVQMLRAKGYTVEQM